MEGPFFFLFILVFIVVGGGGLVWRLFLSPRARAKRALRNAPRVQISSAREGQLAKIVGTLRYDEEHPPLKAPLTERSCIYYETTVEQKKSSGRSSYWKTIIEKRDHQTAFWIEDSSGRALVELDAPKVVLTMDAHFDSGIFNDASPRLEQFLISHGESSEGWIFNKTMRYKEGVLEQGEQVAVFGRCRWEPDPDPRASGGGYREHPKRLKIESPGFEQMLVSDDPATL